MAGPIYSTLKRVTDVAIATTMLVLLIPVFVVVAIAIIVDTGRPVLFKQERVGRGGRHFFVYKFRSLHQCAHNPSAPEEVETRVGRLLRRWAVDELPQLLNVIRGDMSLVGPRPTIPEQVAQYSDFERRRLEVRPGLTGYAQIKGRNRLSWDDRIVHDVWYVDHMSPALDLRILAKTPAVLWSGKGVYGPSGLNDPFSDGRTEGLDDPSPKSA